MNNEHMENEERQIMTFLDEEGNKVEFEAVARIFLEEKEYLLLAPADDTESEDVFVFRVDEVDGKEELGANDYLIRDILKKSGKKVFYSEAMLSKLDNHYTRK